MKVYFIGAGPGAEDLITVRGSRLLSRCRVVLYAGSLVSRDILNYCQEGAEIHDTAGLNLDQQMDLMIKANELDLDVARVHSGDPAIYGATSEQMRRLRDLGIGYEIVPGVSSFTAAAATLGFELTQPCVSQTIIITRSEGRASPMPEGERLGELAKHRSTMAIFLSGANLPAVVEDLLKSYSSDTPAALVKRATWPEEVSHVTTLGKLLEEIHVSDWNLTTMLLVGNVLDMSAGVDSRLYASDYAHRFRKKT